MRRLILELGSQHYTLSDLSAILLIAHDEEREGGPNG